MYAKRFPIPDFNRDELKDKPWTQSAPLSSAEGAKLIERQRAGDAGAYGAYVVQAQDALYNKLDIGGEHRHVLMCVLPDKPLKVLGRSYAWPLQRAVVLDSLEPDKFNIVLDWRTPRPMNTRLGPQDGVSMAGGIFYAICCHKVGEGWRGNRTIVDKQWRGLPAGSGVTIFSSSNAEINDFHDCNLYFAWED